MIGIPNLVDIVFTNGGHADFSANELDVAPLVFGKYPKGADQQQCPEDKCGQTPVAKLL
jgi:hypothetical protein